MNQMIEMKKGVIAYSDNSVNMEKERRNGIYNSSSFVTASISILLGVLITVIFELLDRLSKVQNLVIIFGMILVVILIISLFFSLKSNWFLKKEYTRSGRELMSFINSNLDQFSSEEGFLDQRINDNDSILLSLRKNNDKRVKDMMISTILLYSFFGLIMIFGIVILIVL